MAPISQPPDMPDLKSLASEPPTVGIDNERAVAATLDEARDVIKFSAREHAKLLRKIDWHLLPILWSLFLLSFLDRASIANARIAGMASDLHLVGLRYNTAAAVFFVPYWFGQIPSNIILKFFRPSRWLPITMVAWGLVMTFMCLVKTYHGLIVARVFLGLAEAGLFPGTVYYMSLWYPRAERAKRVAVWLSASSTASAFGGLLAYGIEAMKGIGGLHGWQWIFCLEGIATVLLAFVAPFFMYDYVDTASFLTDTERRYLIDLLKTDSQHLATHFEFQFVVQALKDYKTFLQFGIYIGFLVPTFALALFMPTIINELGFTAAKAQLLSVPPFTASTICMVLTGICSDKQQLRGPYVIAGDFVGLVGFIVLYTQTSPRASYAGAMLAAMGVFSTIAPALTWIGSNAGGDIKRGVAIAAVVGFANLGGICSSYIYFDPPRFKAGHGTMIGLLSFSMLLTLVTMWNYHRINKLKDRTCRECGITEETPEDEFRNMGDDSPLFRYTL